MRHFLKTEKTKIVASKNKPVLLRGINLGGWLMMEAYLLRAPNRPEKSPASLTSVEGSVPDAVNPNPASIRLP